MHEVDDDLTRACRLPDGDDREAVAWLSDEANAGLVDRVAMMNRALDPREFPGLKERERTRLMARIDGRFRHARWAAAAAVVVLGVSAALFFSRRVTPVEEEGIVPGDYRAELVLEDGEVVHLARESREIRGDGSVSVRDDSVGGLMYRDEGRPSASPAPRYNTLKVPAGGFYPVELSDGTRVWLNASSELRYPVVFGDRERVVSLSGEGYFDVTGDAGRPFTVLLEGSRVTVLGTAFNVRAYEGEGKIHATLARGSVSFASELTGRQVLLSPGMQATLEVATGELSTREVDTEVYTAWKDGLFYFKEMTLEEITGTLARWYRLDILYLDQRLKHERYNGKMPMYSGIEDVLRKIEMSGSVRFSIQGRTLVVSE
ncbi:MAG: FecR domain-containing protein [Odoribacteraceae bacterium]|jgi:ferric-dicitrate binding protein FerR (iron transport regulator)|nr:FecR domain-containing protein [Odoribacteraceae bacterium]